MKDTDWASERGNANEPNLDRFIESIGGIKISTLHTNAKFENADYLLPADKVIIELKILETDFVDTDEFLSKLNDLNYRIFAKWGASPMSMNPDVMRDFVNGFIELFRAPLARIAKKANRQIRTTKEQLKLHDHRGVFLCVNNNLRDLSPTAVLQTFGRILNGSYSSIDAMVYLTNHYVTIPQSDHAHLLWSPMYSKTAPDSLSESINNLGRKWFDFCEREHGPFDSRYEGPTIHEAVPRKTDKNSS
ncbi:MAG: hypothetical protein EOO71_05545 [Myxococcaceae bacterium]|nr:MAG: hypothetical protein EOO71_05545 [Myxococcaceae bacterium]